MQSAFHVRLDASAEMLTQEVKKPPPSQGAVLVFKLWGAY
jgi:hypothetical protein